jgi:hypothetical protein
MVVPRTVLMPNDDYVNAVIECETEAMGSVNYGVELQCIRPGFLTNGKNCWVYIWERGQRLEVWGLGVTFFAIGVP